MSESARQEEQVEKGVIKTIAPKKKHWVGNGFHVNTMFSIHSEDYYHVSPFILMDYASPKEFSTTQMKRGVGAHPHRGFETVTFAIQGSVDHRDSTGGGGRISSGDVQWMTAGSGIIHEEFHGEDFAKSGGTFEMVQLWVNLPRNKKMTDPKYQALLKKDQPIFESSNKIAKIKLLAGKFSNLDSNLGPASTHTKINIYEINFTESGNLRIDLEDGTNTVLVQLNGTSKLGGTILEEGHVAILERGGNYLDIEGDKDSHILVLNGDPIDEPIYQYGPFVMNTKEEIIEAFRDFEAGKMGNIHNF